MIATNTFDIHVSVFFNECDIYITIQKQKTNISSTPDNLNNII